MLRSFEQIVDELISIEMSEGSHMDNLEDYESSLEFYLSSVKKESYVNWYLEDFLTEDEQKIYNLSEIQVAVIDGITEKSND